MSIELARVPAPIRRKAAQHLESIRGTPMAPDAASARLGDEVWPIYRPDLEEIAYYEFSVELGSGQSRLVTSAAGLSALLTAERKTVNARAKRAVIDLRERVGPSRASGRGFIVVSAGAHDFPIPHWSLDRQPVSAQLQASDEKGGEIERIYRLDALAYVAEAKDGTLVGRVGQMPGLVAGLPHDLRRSAGGASTLDATPVGEGKTDDQAEGIEHEVKRTEERIPDLKPLDVQDWASFRERYADAFGPFLDDLRRQAAHAWEVEALIEAFGEGIREGETQRIALLDRESVVELSGEGARHVVARLDEASGSPALVLTVPDRAEITGELDLFVDIRYPDGTDERLRYFIVSSKSPSNRRTTSAEGGR
jgi:hypothetical protein